MDYSKRPGKSIIITGELLNNEKPTISIITPFYNGGKTLMETANSVFSQTYPFFEWIIVDDGSKDAESLKELSKLESMSNKIKVYHKENGGPSIARDFGISKASKSTKYVFFLDCDDIIDKTMLECLYWTLETHPDGSFAYTTMVNFGEREFIWEKYLTTELEKTENLICISSLVKKDDLLEVGCFGIKEKAMYEDWNLWLKLIQKGKKPVRVSSPLFWYRTSNTGELSRAQKNNDNAMKYVNETASKIKEDVEVIQFPRINNKFARIIEKSMVLPNYKKANKKNILYIFPWLKVGGADYFNLELIKRLPKEKYNAIILTTLPYDNSIRQKFEDYATVYDMASFLDVIDYQEFADYIISSRNVELVFISNSKLGYYMCPYLKSKYPNIPFIDYIHSVDLKDKRGGFGICTKDVNEFLNHTYVCNNFTKNQLIQKFNKKNVDTIYIGTDTEKFDPNKYDKNEILTKYNIPKNKKIISFVARLSEEKRPLTFIKIAKQLHNIDKNTFFIIGGDGPLLNEIKMKTDNNFKVLGNISNPEEIYRISDITVNCSRLEGLALTSYESLAMEVPVISSNVGGQSELIDDKVGKIIEYDENSNSNIEIDKYVNGIIQILKDHKNISKNCRKRIVDNFSYNIMANKFDEIFEKSIKEKNNSNFKFNKNYYEIMCESNYDEYSNYVSTYYFNLFNIDIEKMQKSKYAKTYKGIKGKLINYNAVNEGRRVLDFLRRFKYIIKDIFNLIIRFFIASYSILIIIIKILLYYVKKLVKK